MAVRPIATSHQEELNIRGSGKLGRTTDYLKAIDPTSYYYLKFKNSNNRYLKDDMWTEAAKRGEIGNLITLLEKSNDYKTNEFYDKWEDYQGLDSYDGYMLALAMPTLDDTTKKDRIDDETGTVYGQYSDKEWAKLILDTTLEKYDAKMIEENKANLNFFQKAGAYLVSGVTHVAAGVSSFGQDIFNLGEGIINIFADWGNDSDIGNRFLWAFSNDEGQPFNEAVQLLQYAAFDFERKYTSVVNAEKAYEEGFRLGEGATLLEQIDNAVGVGSGYTTWGKWWAAGTESIGYMLPSMLVPIGAAGSGVGTGAKSVAAASKTLGSTLKIVGTAAKAARTVGLIKQGIFYTGIFSGNIKNTVNLAMHNGQTYKDLNAGTVVVNAITKAGAQLAIEHALGFVMGFSGLDKLMGIGTKTAGKVVSDVSKTGLRAMLPAIGRGAKDMLKEGLEEFLQDMSDGIIDSTYGGMYRDRAVETLSIENLVDSFVVGALVSGVTGAITNLSVTLPKNRAIGMDSSGELYKMGIFQTLNYRDAIKTMSSWKETINDPDAKIEKKTEAALKMSIAMNTVGSVLKTMGMDRAIKANQVLIAQADIDNKKETNKALQTISSVGYANLLYDKFEKAYGEVNIKYKAKVLKALAEKAEKLKKKGIDTINNVITKDTDPNNPNIPVEGNVVSKIKGTLESLGAEAIVGVNGGIVTKSGEIIFADNRLVQAGDITEIVRALAYDQVQDTVESNLNSSQKKMILTQYSKITGTEGTIDEAITALLFDKRFYTKMLLLSGERSYSLEAIKVLATIDRLVKTKVSEQLQNGTTTIGAYNALMAKVYETMRAGLITYATQYIKLDLGEISNEVLSKEIKDQISNHRNVYFTEFIDKGIKDKKPTTERIAALDNLINKYSDQLTADQVKEAKRKARSTEANDQIDVHTLMTQLVKNSEQSDKLVYLTADATEGMVQENITAVEDFFGITWSDMIEGKIDPNHFTEEAKDFILSKNYDMSVTSSRMACLREIMFNKSGHTLTVGVDGTLLKIIEKSEFLKDRYLGVEGSNNFRKDYNDGKIKKISDITKINLPKEISDFDIIVDTKLKDINGSYKNGETRIILNKSCNLDTLMHEITHATQWYTAKGIETIQGGSLEAFKVLPKNVITSLEDYISEHFPLTYEYMLEHKVTTPQLVYFMLSGELQANSTMATHMFEVGFRWRNDKTILVSPDGKTTWSMLSATSKIIAEKKAEIKAEQQETRRLQREMKVKQRVEKETKVDKDISEDSYLFTDKQYDEESDKTINEEAKKILPLSFEQANNANRSREMTSGFILSDGTIGFPYENLEHDQILEEFDYAKLKNENWLNKLVAIGFTISGDIYLRVPKNITYSQVDSISQLSKDYPNKRFTIDYFDKKPGVKQSTFYQGRGPSLLRDLENKIKESTESITKETTISPNDINFDAPLTKEAMTDLKENPANQAFMKDGFLKTRNGTPIVWYRGGDAITGFETMESADLGYKLGEFYTTTYEAAESYNIRPGSVNRGYISNVSQEATAMYNAKGRQFYDLGDIVSQSDIKILKDLRTQYADLINAIHKFYDGTTDKTTKEIDTEIRKYLKDDANKWDRTLAEIMNEYNFTKDKAIKFIVSIAISTYKGGINITTDSLIAVNLVKGKDAIIVQHVVEDYDKPITDLILLKSGLQKRVTFSDNDINWDKVIGEKKEVRYISNKTARESNLKYWIKRGTQIQIDPGVSKFVVATTNDFNKLPNVLKTKIQDGTLTKHDIINYVSTAAFINDYTFKMIAREVFGNNDLAKLTYNDMRNMMDDIENLASLAYLTDDINTKMTPKKMLQTYKTTIEQIQKEGSKGEAALTRAQKRVQSVKLKSTTDKTYFVESHADTKQLNSAFFRHYDGTINSIRHINNLGKYMSVQQTELSTRDNESTKSKNKVWNWISRKKIADIDYETDDVTKTLNTISREEKINEIENYVAEIIAERIRALPANKRVAQGTKAMSELNERISELHNLSDKEVNQRYLVAINSEALKKTQRPVQEMVAAPKVQERTTKNRKDRLRNLAAIVTKRIAGIKSRYNALSPEVKANLDPKKYKLTVDYRTLTDAQLDTLIDQFSESAKRLRERISLSERAKLSRAQTQTRIDEMARKTMTPKSREIKAPEVEKKTLRQKVQIEYTTTIKEQTFEIVTSTPAPDLAKKVLNTAWDKTRVSTVQALSNNVEKEVANKKQFFEQNAKAIMESTLSEIENTVRWFLDARMNNITDAEYQKFLAVKAYFLGFVFTESDTNKLYADMDHNLKQRNETWLKTKVTESSTFMSIWNNTLSLLNPMDVMKNADMEIDGVMLSDSEKDALFEAASSGNIDAIKDIQQRIIKRIEKERTSKKSILRKITSVRSMSMLSSPITWLRNKVSNMALKRLNKLASRIGNRLWTGKTVKGQLKMDQNVSPEIQAFINKHFIDNKLFDTIVSNLSRYNPSDISERFKDATGKANKDAIFAQMVIKSMYNEYYNNHMFESKFLRDVHQKLMKMLSDNSYIREAAVRYFGKIVAEKGYDVSKDTVSDSIMNDFGMAIGLGLSDYMHSTNLFNQIETWLSTGSDKEGKELVLFAYKTILPFASAGWQWAKAAIKLSPIGLGRAIFNMARLEKKVAYAQDAWAKGNTQVSPELTEYIARRDLGQGVIGTIGCIVGMILAGMNYIELEDDDYGTPKLRIGNLRIDVSSIFGSSSLLAGAALVTGFNEKGINWEGFIAGMDRAVDVTIDAIPLMQIVEMDMYSKGGFSMGMDQLESIALSFIPNILAWIAGATYSGNLKKRTFLGRATAKIPFLGPIFNERKVDPYTGDQGSWWDAFNRVVPYFSLDTASDTEKTAKGLGLNKSELRGQYTVNNESFNVSGKDLTLINEMYGKWNAIDLEKFYQNQMSIKIKVDNTYKTLSFNQMTDIQRKSAVQTIMTNNSELAKIMAWIKAGNKYYASATMYSLLRQRGITSNVYRGTKGFVSK